MKILLVDRSQNALDTSAVLIERAGHSALKAHSPDRAKTILSEEQVDAVLVDEAIGQEDNFSFVNSIYESYQAVPVIVMSEQTTVETAVTAMRNHACDYVQKPLVPDHLSKLLARQSKPDRKETGKGMESTADREAHAKPDYKLVFQSGHKPAQHAFDIAFKAAPTDASILLLGPSGTGKSALAYEIHRRSNRNQGPFITVSCPSLSRELLESELFGHVKGAFTGAIRDSHGKVEAASGGTLFLDEIGDMPLEIQPKLLRLLQDMEYERLGETRTRVADIRVISATNTNISEQVTSGRFREDLLFRLNVISVHIPSMKHRVEDLPEMINHYLKVFRTEHGRPELDFEETAFDMLASHTWPGNLREMSNAIERAVILAENSAITCQDLPLEVRENDDRFPALGSRATLAQIEEAHIRKILATAASMEEAAEILGINTATLYRKRKRLGLD
jgi:NtrC-family two-component system response regulator AlgB